MKGISAGKKLPAATICWGILALVLRWQLYRAGVDGKALLVRNHPLSIALAVLTVGVLVRILLVVRKLGNGNSAEGHPPASLPGALGSLAAGAGILVTVMTDVTAMGNHLESIWRCLGFAAPVCLFLAAVARLRGKRPFFLLYVVACLFFVLHIVSRYQFWSGNPQMQDYVFSLLGAMALMFFGFYSAAWNAGCGSIRMLYGMGLAAIYLCTAELARSFCPALYLGGICWVLTELCSIEPVCADDTN